MIELAGIGRTMGGRRVLQDFSLKVYQGERLVLYGPSGSGKTTILRLIAGFLAPDQGAVFLNGALASSAGRIVIPPERRGIGFVFQDLALWPHMTVFQNVEFPLKTQNVAEPERRRQVADALAKLELSGFADSYPTRLSGGQQQRVALARAIIGGPSLVLMDEPLASLDEDLQSAVTGQILRLHQELAFTLVYVTHSRQERQSLATRSVLIQDCAGAGR